MAIVYSYVVTKDRVITKTPHAYMPGCFQLWWVIVERCVTTYVFGVMFVFATFAV